MVATATSVKWHTAGTSRSVNGQRLDPGCPKACGRRAVCGHSCGVIDLDDLKAAEGPHDRRRGDSEDCDPHYVGEHQALPGLRVEERVRDPAVCSSADENDHDPDHGINQGMKGLGCRTRNPRKQPAPVGANPFVPQQIRVRVRATPPTPKAGCYKFESCRGHRPHTV